MLLDLKAQIDPNTMIVRDVNTPLSPIDSSSTHTHTHTHTHTNNNKETSKSNDTIDHTDLKDIYRVFHPTAAQYTCFLATHGTFSKIGHI
jgi:exonuclease III